MIMIANKFICFKIYNQPYFVLIGILVYNYFVSIYHKLEW